MPQYLVGVMHDDPSYGQNHPAAEMAEIIADVGAVNQKMMDAGVFVFAGGLHPPTATTTVDGQSGTVTVTDGPYAEAKEFLGGFWVIQVDDLNSALTWARQATVACRQPLEVRPFMEEPPQGA